MIHIARRVLTRLAPFVELPISFLCKAVIGNDENIQCMFVSAPPPGKSCILVSNPAIADEAPAIALPLPYYIHGKEGADTSCTYRRDASGVFCQMQFQVRRTYIRNKSVSALR